MVMSLSRELYVSVYCVTVYVFLQSMQACKYIEYLIVKGETI